MRTHIMHIRYSGACYRHCTTLGLAVILLAGCARTTPPTLPTPLGLHSWIITDPAALVAAIPADRSDLPAAPGNNALPAFARPVVAWMDVELDAIKRDGMTPPRAARSIALMAVTLNDSLLVAETARAAHHPVSDQALLAAAAARLLQYTHPIAGARGIQLAQDAQWIDVWQGHATTGALQNGQALGNAVATQVITWATQDGADALPPTVDLANTAPGRWQRTAPQFDFPLEPGWGRLKPLVLPSGAAARATQPPAWESNAFQQDRANFAKIQDTLTPKDLVLAEQWAGGMGTVTPAGLWVEIARDLALRNHLTNQQAAGMFAALGVALHDSFIACWESKYHYMVVRPIQWMQETHKDWQPTLRTPPFPSYPSGHATASGAAAAILSSYFPDDAVTLQAQAGDAARSRVVGGLHWPLDSAAGLAQGQQIASAVLSRLAGPHPITTTP